MRTDFILSSLPLLPHVVCQNIFSEMSTIPTRYPLPPPLSESEWVGKSELNYTELYGKLAEPIACMKVPLGVLGYYLYLAEHVMSVLMMAWTIRTIHKLNKKTRTNEMPEKPGHSPNNDRGRFGALRSLLTFTFTLFLLIQSCRTVRDCSSRLGLIGASNILAIVWSSLTQLASLFSLFASMPCFSDDTALGLNICALLVYGVAWSVNLPPGFVFSVAVFQAGGVIQSGNAYFFRWLDAVYLGATMVAEIPAMLITAILVIWGIGYYCATADDKTGKRVLKYSIACFAYVFLFFWTGTSFVSLGKIFGSPWGKWWIMEEKGEVYVVWATLFPVLQSFLTFLGW